MLENFDAHRTQGNFKLAMNTQWQQGTQKSIESPYYVLENIGFSEKKFKNSSVSEGQLKSIDMGIKSRLQVFTVD